MSDLTPPPDEPIPPQTRDKIRADLLARAQGPASRAPRWAVPAMGAAAVLLVVGLAGWAVNLGGEGSSGAAPAGGGPTLATTLPTSTVSDQPTPNQPPEPSSIPSTEGSYPATNVPPPGGHQAGSGSCREEMANVVDGTPELAFAFPRDPGGPVVSFYVVGQQFVMCDVWLGTTTVHKALPLSPADGVSTYAVSSLYDASNDAVRTAGGIVPAGLDLRKIVYTFPDGRQVPARTASDAQGRRWWVMYHDYPSSGNELNQPPITVAVFTSGGEQDYTLRYGLDTCAQANHGC